MHGDVAPGFNRKLEHLILHLNCTERIKSKIKSSLYSPYYAEACNELRGPFPRLSAWATQLRRNVATVASRWRHCVDLTGPGIEPQTSRTDSVRLATELTAGCTERRKVIFRYIMRFKIQRKKGLSGLPAFNEICEPFVRENVASLVCVEKKKQFVFY